MHSDTGGSSALLAGVHAVAWGYPPSDLVVPGMMWRWSGQAVRLDRGVQALWLGRPLARQDNRPRARTRLTRLALAPATAAPPDLQRGDTNDTDALSPGALVLTDGRRLYPARLVTVGGQATVVFDPWLPPPDTDLWVTACAPLSDRAGDARPTLGGIGAGAMIDTPDGARAVETLSPGDLVLTRDSGAQPLLWVGETRLSGAELRLHPHLRPLRVLTDRAAKADRGADIQGAALRPVLRLAPGHRMVVPGLPGMAGLAGPVGRVSEALATAADLEDGRRIRRDLGCVSVAYIHLMLPRHEVVRVGGIDVETFHPGLSDPVALRWHARGLERAVPGVTSTPHRFGDPALRCLTRAEAALLAAA